MSKEAMQMALEWFQWFHNGNTIESPKSSTHVKKALEEALAQPAERQGEAVMIYHGRCVIDCGEHGHQDVEMLKMIPAGSLLYTRPASAPAQQPLTDEQIQDLLSIGNPTEEECRLIRLGWEAANGIGGEK